MQWRNQAGRRRQQHSKLHAETHKNLVKEVLDELLLEGSTRQETMQVGTEELGDKVDVLERGNEDVGERDDVFVLDVLQELELSVSALGEDGCACVRARGPWVSRLGHSVCS